ncbi:MAG: hypothetical protein AAF250_11000 [Pseudomonadota bacterium]
MNFSTKLLSILAGAVLLLGNGPFADDRLLAQGVDEDTPEEISAYADLYEALDEGTDHEAMLDSTMTVVRQQFAALPEVAEAEQSYPGLINGVMTEIRPVFRDYLERQREVYRSHLIAAIGRVLTPSEARSLAEVHRSELGRRLLQTVSLSFSPDATLEDSADYDRTVEGLAARYEDDSTNAQAETARTLTQEELVEVQEFIRERPALLKAGRLNRELALVTAEMKEPPNADELARLQAAQERAFTRHLGD